MKYTKENPLKIGMFGAGTVGGGVYEILQAREDIKVTKICARSIKARDFCKDLSVFTTNPDEILKDSSINCVIEVMGGVELAKRVVVESLQAGKAVVTANKALVAEHLDELHNICKASGASLSYEAAVCGGINIISSLATHYQLDPVLSIQGIANGTTNYMLSCMEQGEDYHTVLKRAQELGYAEADPTADVEGHDVRSKLAILAKLGFGLTVPIKDIPTIGISGVTAEDFANAKSMGCTIKLIGTAAAQKTGKLTVFVSPRMVPAGSALGACSGSGNLVSIESKHNQVCTFSGPGAGRYPTAQSIVADVLKVAGGTCQTDPFPTNAHSNMAVDGDYTARFYARSKESKLAELADEAGLELEQKDGFWLSKKESLRYSQMHALKQAIPDLSVMPIDL